MTVRRTFQVEMLEDRTTPAVFTAELVSGPLGEHGSSAAYVVGGGLTIDPAHTQNLSGPAWVTAANETEAIKLGIVGPVTVDLSPVGKPQTTYQFQPSNVGSGPPAPFRIVADPSNVPGAQVTKWVIQLEDMAAYPAQCDNDYNDTTWTVVLTNYSLPQPAGPGAVAGTVWLDTLRNNQLDPVGTANQPGDGRQVNTLVTLLDGDGRTFATTYTDAAGKYSFASLPYGTYQMTVSIWGVEWFVTPGPSNSTSNTDSDVGANGRTVPFQVNTPGTATNPSREIDAGVFLASPHPNDYQAYGPLVRIFRPEENTMADELKVAKWSGGNDRASDAFESNPTDDFPQLKGVEPGGYDFIDRDPDRFNIFVMNRDTTADFIDVTLSTDNTDPKKAAYKDNPTTIRLVKMTIPGWEHWYWSDSLLLVSNAVDDGFARAPITVPGGGKTGGGIGADNQPPDGQSKNQKNGHDFPLGDRTFRVALGSKVKVVYAPNGNNTDPQPVEVPVNIRKRLTVRAYILKDPNLTDAQWKNDGVQGQVISKAAVEDDFRVMREIFAQAGIEVNAETITVESVPAAANGLPAVDLTDGVPFPTEADFQWSLSPEMKGLVRNTVSRTLPDNYIEDVEIFYVNYFDDDHTGVALTRSWIPDADEREYADAAVVGVKGKAQDVLAHEVFHIIENRKSVSDSHFPYGGLKHGHDRVNLMVEGPRAINEFTHVEGNPFAPWPPPVLWSRRLTQEQQNEADTGAQRKEHLTDPYRNQILY